MKKAFWAMAAAGAALRVYLVVWTPGTYDVANWHTLATAIHQDGLLHAYRTLSQLNHPPLAAGWAALLIAVAQKTAIHFPILLRAPVALLDWMNIFLLLALWHPHRHRYLIAGLYALHPVALLLSAYHGNTDSLTATCLLIALLAATRQRPLLTGMAIGVSLWIKLPALLTLPAFALSFPEWKDRGRCLLAAGVTMLLPCVPLLIQAPLLLAERVWGYRGQLIHTGSGQAIWGPFGLLEPILRRIGHVPTSWIPLIQGWHRFDTVILLIPIVATAWWRRHERGVQGIGKTVLASYVVVYGLSTHGAFQYFAWSLPFWFFGGRDWCAAASALSSLYLYGLYAWLSGDVALRGAWDFAGHPLWPAPLVLLRNLGTLFFMGSVLVHLRRDTRLKPPSKVV